jgi:hemerythrin
MPWAALQPRLPLSRLRVLRDLFMKARSRYDYPKSRERLLRNLAAYSIILGLKRSGDHLSLRHGRRSEGGGILCKSARLPKKDKAMDASEAYLSHKVLDAEHQGQIDLLLQVENEFSGAANPARLAFLLDRLIEFTDIHFMSEQVLMRERAYPGLPAHEEEHSQLIEHMRSFQRRVEAEGRRLTADQVSGLRGWVLHHIQTKDAAFARYLGRDA